jgi:hypothetical protein
MTLNRQTLSLSLAALLLALGSCSPIPPQALSSQVALQSQSNLPKQNWQVLNPMPEPRYNLQVTALQGKIYLSGGFNDRAVLDSFEVFEPASRTWQTLPPIPGPRYIHAAVALDSSLYLIGGYKLGAQTRQLLSGQALTRGAMGEVDRYDATTQRWEALPPLQTPRFMPAATVHQGQIFVAGGGGPERQILSSIEIYQPQTRTWKKGFELPEPRVWGQLLSDGRYLYWLGGINANKNYLSQIDRFDPQTGQWKMNAFPAMPVARAGFAATINAEGIYLVGGTNEQGFVAQADFLNFKTGQWQSLPPIQPARAGAGLVSDPQGLYLFGTDAWYTNNALFLPWSNLPVLK